MYVCWTKLCKHDYYILPAFDFEKAMFYNVLIPIELVLHMINIAIEIWKASCILNNAGDQNKHKCVAVAFGGN